MEKLIGFVVVNKMLDIKEIRKNTDRVKNGLIARREDPLIVDRVLELDRKLRNLKAERDELRHQLKVASRKFYEDHKNLSGY